MGLSYPVKIPFRIFLGESGGNFLAFSVGSVYSGANDETGGDIFNRKKRAASLKDDNSFNLRHLTEAAGGRGRVYGDEPSIISDCYTNS